MEKRRILPSLIFFVHIVLISNDFVNCDFIHPVEEEEYQVLLSLQAENFASAKRERSSIENAAGVKFWRLRGCSQQIKVKKCYCLTIKE